MEDVLIIGAGLAGLTCARRLREAGVSPLVVEAADDVGGRVRTDRVEGFLLDRGFQVLLTAYPEARRWLDYDRLALRPFEPGAQVRVGGEFCRVSDPWRRPQHAWATLRAPVGSLTDKLRILSLRHQVRQGTIGQLWEKPETSTLAALQRHGFSPEIIERFFRPFLGGVLLDAELASSSRMFEFVFRMFSAGRVAVPATGMHAIPRQLAEALPADRLRLNAPVARIHGREVQLETGEVIQARRVVVATAGGAARRLFPAMPPVGWRSVTTLYFAAPQSPVGEGILVLNGGEPGPINTLTVMSDVAPAYAPAGQALVSISVLGAVVADEDELARQVQVQLQAWDGTQVLAWRLLRIYRVVEALPAGSPTAPAALAMGPEVVVCGDHCGHGSIQGAMESGRRAAEFILG